MILNYNISPSSDGFTELDVVEVCKSLGGDLDTITCLHGKGNKLICGDFELELSYREFEKISKCSKYFSVHDDFERCLHPESEEKLQFTCVVMRPRTEKMIVVELDPHFTKRKSAIEFFLETDGFHLNFFQNREKFFIEYQTSLHPHNPKLTVFEITLVDERHVWKEDENSITSLN